MKQLQMLIPSKSPINISTTWVIGFRSQDCSVAETVIKCDYFKSANQVTILKCPQQIHGTSVSVLVEYVKTGTRKMSDIFWCNWTWHHSLNYHSISQKSKNVWHLRFSWWWRDGSVSLLGCNSQCYEAMNMMETVCFS